MKGSKSSWKLIDPLTRRSFYRIASQRSGPLPHGPVPANIAEGPTPAAGPSTPLKEILSPMVGTFYRAPSPDSAPYAEVGQEINEESLVCIIEAMKVMNEIKAEIKGVIAEILVENGTPVQFGQPLIRVI